MTRGSTTQTRTFSYDSSTQRLTQATTPEAGTVQYSYNNDGTLQSKTDAMGQQTQYQYDSLARVTRVSYLPNSQEDTCQRVYYRYDGYPYDPSAPTDPGLLGLNSIGRLTGMSWSGGPGCIYGFQEEYGYDAQGRVWERIFTMTDGAYNPITLTSYFQYDAEGRLTVSQYPAATTISPNATFTYTTDHDALGRPSDLYTGTPQQPGWVVNSATYNAAGQLTAMSTGAYNESRQYNTNLQLARLTATFTGSGQGIDFTYTYPGTGNNGRISQTTDNITGEQVSYTYDQLNRLVQSVSSVTGTMPFAYDGFGNLTQQGQTTLSIDATTNRINSAGYQYNANGNVTQTPGPVSYAYDVANRLVSNGAIYNPRNQRVFDGTYLYLYTPEGKLAGKYAPAWGAYTSSNAYIQGGQPNVYFAGELIQEQGQWVMTDRLGSVRLNGNGARSSYQPYGAEVAPTSDQRTKFATYYRDSAGVDYAGQRYYSNVTGRFLTPDPMGIGTADPSNPGSWNRYTYVQGDPVNFKDPHGLLMAAADEDDEGGGWDMWWVMDTLMYHGGGGGGGVEGGGGGGGGDGQDFYSAQYTRALFSALDALDDPDCARIFNTNSSTYSPRAVLAMMAFGGTATGVPSGTYFGSVKFDRIPVAFNAVTVPDKTTGVWTGSGVQAVSADIYLQTNKLSNGFYGSATVQDLALTLIHELGHVFNIVSGLGGSKIVWDANPNGTANQAAEDANAKTLQKCHPE